MSSTYSTNDTQEICVTVKVECAICTNIWIAVYQLGTDVIQCPHCGLINKAIILQ